MKEQVPCSYCGEFFDKNLTVATLDRFGIRLHFCSSVHADTFLLGKYKNREAQKEQDKNG